MTIRPCNEFIDCECSDNPFINTSAEAPDPNLFFARRYFPNIPSLNVDDSWYQRAGCLGVCRSDESQQEADDCALRDSQLCTWSQVQPPLTLLSEDPSSVPRSNIFGNTAVSCSSLCPNGPPFVFTVPANTFYGLTQQEADALAQSVCEYRALLFRICQGIPPEPPVCDVTITSVMPSSLVQESEVGDSVAFGVTFDYTGMQNPTFLWLKDGFPLTQTENPSLAISPVIAEDAGFYRLAIIVPNCPTVVSPPIELIVNPCSQSGSPIPDPLFSNDQTPIDLGSFVTPPGADVSVGSWPPGSFEITYEEGSYGKNLGENPCPMNAFIYSGGNNIFVASGFSGTLLSLFGSACGNSSAEIQTAIFASGVPLDTTVDHDGGFAMFTQPGTGALNGAPNPTWGVIYTPSPAPPAAQEYEIDDFSTVSPGLVNPSWTDDPMLAPWNGRFGNNPADVVFDFLYIRIGISDGNPSNCANAQRVGTKRVSYTILEGPYTGNDIAGFFPELANLVTDGVLVGSQRYWTMSTQDCCHVGDPCGFGAVGTLGWYGVKEYGDDVDGRYRKVYGEHPSAPNCVTVNKI